MTLVLLISFGIAAALPVATALRRQGGFVQFSFLGGLVFLGQLFLQAIGVVRSADSVPHGGLVRALLMCTLCALAMHLGWEKRAVRGASIAVLVFPRVFAAGMVFIVVGMTGFLLLTRLSGGIAAHFSTAGHYALDWRGYPVAYVFFMAYLAPGIFLALTAAMRERSLPKYLAVAAPLAVQAAFIVLLGRRAVLFETVIVILAALWFGRRYEPARGLILAGAALGAVAMYAAPYYRAHSQIGGSIDKLREIDVGKAVTDPVNGLQEEFYNAAWVMDIVGANHAYQYGAGIYNYLIASFVPKLITGEGFKERLLLDLPGKDLETNDYSWHIRYGANMSGPASAYVQFWFFGCLWFYALARFMKRLYDRAVLGDLCSQCLYVGCLVHAMQSIGNYMYMVLNPLVMIGPVLWVLVELLTLERRQDSGRARLTACVT